MSRAALVDSIARAARVTVIAAPPGSGKTFLLRSWIEEAGLAERTAFVSVQREQRDAQQFWTSVVESLRATEPGSQIVGALGAAPSFDGWAAVERLLGDLVALEERLWLVLDDLHELSSDEALRQLELLLLRAPETVRFVLATRQDLRLGLHRLRLSGELTEIRGDELRFAHDEARIADGRRRSEAVGFGARAARRADGRLGRGLETCCVVARRGIQIRSASPPSSPAASARSQSTCSRRCSSAKRQPVRQLLLRTSILERVNGPLADLLTGSRWRADSAGARRRERARRLARLEPFVVPLSPSADGPPSSRAAAHRAGRRLEAARCGRRLVRDARLSGRGGATHAGRGTIGRSRPAGSSIIGWSSCSMAGRKRRTSFSLDSRRMTSPPIPSHHVGAADELNRGSLAEAERCLELATREIGIRRAGAARAVSDDARDRAARTRAPTHGCRRGNEAAELLLAPAEAPMRRNSSSAMTSARSRC